MAGRLKLAAQVLALALVTGLFALLVWKVATQDEGAAPKLSRGETPPAPLSASTASTGRASFRSPRTAGGR